MPKLKYAIAVVLALLLLALGFSGRRQILQKVRLDVAVEQGDAFFRQGQLNAAASEYKRGIKTFEQGERVEVELATAYRHLGECFLVWGRWEEAITAFGKTIELQQWTGAEKKELARSFYSLGNAFFAQGKPFSAIEPYGKAIENGGMTRAYLNRGNAFLALSKIAQAQDDYEKAEHGDTRMVALNNHGVVRRIQRDIEGAVHDFETALTNGSALKNSRALSELDVAIVYNEKSLDVLPRVRVVDEKVEKIRDITRAIVFRNLGYALGAKGNFEAAVRNLQNAAEIYERLGEGERPLAGEFGRTLSSIAWIRSTAPIDSLRNGAKASELARKGCELTGWKSSFALEALAAACAEAGNFPEAISQQEKAIELAPREQQVELRVRLQQFKMGKPYRTATKN